MKKRFNLIIYMLMTIILSTLPINYVHGATGSIIATASSSSVAVGATVKVTVRISSASELGSWRFDLNYDSNKLRLSPTSSPASVAGYYTASGQKSATYSYTFTAIASGNTVVSVRNGAIVGIDESFMSVTSTGTSINIVPKSTQPDVADNYSGNAYLSSLQVEGSSFSPGFDKNIMEYSVELEAGTEAVNILAVPEDSRSVVSGVGEVSVLDGINRLEVRVVAENGDEMIYIIKAMVEESDPVEVMIGNDKYRVVRRIQDIEPPANYIETSVTIGNREVPGLMGEITRLTLVVLKSDEGEIGFFVYNEKDDSFILYREFRLGGITFYPHPKKDGIKVPAGYRKFILKIEDDEIDAYRMDEESRYSLMYGMNVETGKSGFYLYDQDEGTLQRYNMEESIYHKDILIKYLIGLLVLGSALLGTGIFSGRMIKRKKKIKK